MKAYTGFKTIKGREVYMEDGYILYGIGFIGDSRITKHMFEYNKKYNGFVRIDKLSESAYRARIARETLIWN